eukprot:gene2227-2536_t
MANIGKSCSNDEDIAPDVEEDFANDTMETIDDEKKNAQEDNAFETVECSYSIPREDDICFEDTEVKYYEEDIVDERINSAFITKVKNITLEDNDNDPNFKQNMIDPKIVSSPHKGQYFRKCKKSLTNCFIIVVLLIGFSFCELDVSSIFATIDTIWNCGPVSYIKSKIGMIHISKNKTCELKGTTYVCDEV